jgi:hypothetical protein
MAAAAACSGGEKTVAVSPVKTVAVTVTNPSIAVGGQTQASALLLDANGAAITDRLPMWTSQSPTIASVSSSGLITGITAGTATIRASSGVAAGDVLVTVANPVAASVAFDRDTATITIPNGAVQILVTVKDSAGTKIQSPTLFWQSASPLIATVSATGLVTGVAIGTTTVRASTDGQTATVTITVKTTPSGTAATITSIAPSSVLRPGASYVITGTNFAATTINNIVLIDGVAATVTAATTTQLNITLPSAGFSCDPTHAIFLQINANGQIGGGPATFQAANARALAVGQSVVISAQSEVRCNELSLTGGKYLLSVYNASRASVTSGATAATSIVVRGAVALSAVGTSIVAPVMATAVRAPAFISNVPRIGSPAFDIAERIRRSREQDALHARLLEFNTNLLRREGATLKANLTAARALNRSRGTFAPGIRSNAIGSQIATPVGAISSVKIPNIDAGNVCFNNIPINVRTVYNGQHAIIVEDTLSVFAGKTTLQGQMNAYFTQLGQEFDTVMWPILTANFGNPLAMDSQLSGTGKVVMVFSPRVNQQQGGGVLGFVVSCDFQLPTAAPSSNYGEFFYAVVPTSTAAAYANQDTKDSWLRVMRATVIHEVKHITSFGEHLSRNLTIEEVSWEEGMARAAEELYARTFYGTMQKGNVTYQQSLYCDIRYTTASLPQCLNRPLLMMRHFDNLYGYAVNSEVLTPLGRPFPSDPTFYGSAWSVERWANDQFGTNEAQFFKDFTTSSVTGPQNIEARTGRPWEESMGEWSLSMYLAGRAGFTSTNNARVSFPGYNLADIYAGMCADLGPCTTPNNPQQLYPSATPYAPHQATFGNFSTTIPSLVGGGVSYFEISGTQTAKQLIEIRAFAGGDPASTVRLAIARLQ